MASGRKYIAYSEYVSLEHNTSINVVSYISPVEWVEVTSGTVTGGDCYVTADIGNIKSELGSCEYINDGIPYISGTDESTTPSVCSDGATYTTCTYNSGGGYWNCQDYIGSIPVIKYECKLKD